MFSGDVLYNIFYTYLDSSLAYSLLLMQKAKNITGAQKN